MNCPANRPVGSRDVLRVFVMNKHIKNPKKIQNVPKNTLYSSQKYVHNHKSKICWSKFLVFGRFWFPNKVNIQRIDAPKINDLCTNNGDFSVKYKKCVNVWLIEINYFQKN